MKEVFRAHDITKVSYYRDLLEAAGIRTMLRNENLVHGVVEVPIPEFFPNLCIMNDEDYERGREMIQKEMNALDADPGSDRACTACGEMNPGNFGECFSCQEPMPLESC